MKRFVTLPILEELHARPDDDGAGRGMDGDVHLLALPEPERLDHLGREGHGEGTARLDDLAPHVSIKYLPLRSVKRVAVGLRPPPACPNRQAEHRMRATERTHSMHRHPTRRDILKLGGTAAASALARPGAAGAGRRRVEEDSRRHAALVRAETARDRHPRHAQCARRNRVRGCRTRERVRQAGNGVAEAPRCGQAEGVRVPPHAWRTAGRQARGDDRVQPGRREPQPDHPVARAGGLQVGGPPQADSRRGERGGRQGQTAQDARRVPQPLRRLQPDRRRVPGGTSSPTGRRRTSSCSSTRATPRS